MSLAAGVSNRMLKDIKILIVDASESHRESLKAPWGRNTSTEFAFATSADDALAAVAANSFDCIVVDPGLPGVTAFGSWNILQKEGCETPVLFVTAELDDVIAAKAVSSSAVGYALSKPLLPAAVEQTIVRWRESSRLSAIVTNTGACRILSRPILELRLRLVCEQRILLSSASQATRLIKLIG